MVHSASTWVDCRLDSPVPKPHTLDMPDSICGFLFTVAAVLSSPLGAAELVVDNVRGSDLAPAARGSQLRPPYRTIQGAVDDAVLGDTISLRDTGTPYQECVSINSNHSLGTETFPLVIEGNGATLDGSRALSVADWTALGGDLFELKVQSPGFVRLIAASDQPVPENQGTISDLSSLAPLQYARQSGLIYFRARRGDVPQAYGLRVCVHPVGITLYDTSHVVVRNLTVTGFRIDGINCHDLANEIVLENIAANQNGRSGISVGGASGVKITLCRLSENGQAQLRTEGQCLVELRETKIKAGGALAIDRDGGVVIETE